MSPGEHLTMSGDILVVTSWGSVTGLRWVEARDAAQDSAVRRANLSPSAAQNYQAHSQ